MKGYKIMKIIFFRHGETDYNVKCLLQGAGINSMLNKKGIQQAKELALKTSSLGLEKIYCSTLTRAIQTATLTAAACGLDVEPIKGVEEFHYGDAEGMTLKAAAEKYIDMKKIIFDEVDESAYDKSLPKGETIRQCVKRFEKALKRIKKLNQGKYKCIGVFTHGAIMCLIYDYFYHERKVFKNCDWFEAEI